MKFEDWRITMDAFGSELPENWEDDAQFLNNEIDEALEEAGYDPDEDYMEGSPEWDDMRRITDRIWENYCAGEYDEESDDAQSGGTLVLLARTNAYDCLIAIDQYNKIARCLTDDKCELCQPDEVEDASSWEEIDYRSAVNDYLENNFEVLARHYFPYDAHIM